MTTALVDAHADAIEADLERREKDQSFVEQGVELSQSLRKYVRASWHVVRPDDAFVDNWHIGAMCELLEEVTLGKIRRLLIWVPPGSMKTITCSVAWPSWMWTHTPSYRFLTCMYDMDMAIETGMLPGRDLIQSPWYQDRWGHVFRIKEDQNRRAAYQNDRGGARFAAAPNAKKVTGRHVHCTLLDDPNDAQSAEALDAAELEKVNGWHDAALPTRFADPKTGVKVIIQQRLHEEDLSGHVIEQEDYTVLCLPERYNPIHQFTWPGDPRSEGELLWPTRIGEVENKNRIEIMGLHRASGQLQQEPAAREGQILKRAFWNYYAAEALEAAEAGDVSLLPGFSHIVCSWDTAFKDKTTNDLVAGGVWGVHGPDRYLLRTYHDHAALAATKTQMLTMREWALARWPNAAVRTLVEGKANGPDIVKQLRRQIPGVKLYNPGNADKTQRAIAAEPDLDSGHVFIAGAARPPLDELGRGKDYVPVLTPAWAQEVIEQCARFPKGKHDDLVDMATQAINWIRLNIGRGTSLHSPADEQLPPVAGIPVGVGSILGA